MARFVDKTRTGIPGVKGLERVTNSAEWGERTATERYNGGTRTFPSPEIANKPQRLGDKNNLQGPGYDNIVPSDSWLRGGGKNQAEGKPNFHPGVHGKK